jgi:hypothetical protein
MYSAMRRYLRQLYSISLSSSIVPLEQFITSIVGQIPIPVEGGRPFHIILDAALISPTSRSMPPISFHLPTERFFPLMDLDFAGPLRSFSVEVLLAVYTLMLREAKIVFLSHSNALLTETMETLRMLLFPLEWSSCFVSRLPAMLTGLLQAPGGFMVGVHVDCDPNHEKCTYLKHFIRSMHLQYPILPGTYVIDLTNSTINMFDGKYTETMTSAQVDQVSKALPYAPKLRLKAKLAQIAEEFRIGPQLDDLDEIDSAFDFSQAKSNDFFETEVSHHPPRDWSQFPTLVVRDAFMSFMADLLGDYPSYIIPPVDDLSPDTYRTFKEEFMVEEYLQHADASCKLVSEYLMETQMFSVLLQTRSEGTSQSLVFFEEAASLQKTLGLSLLNNKNGVSELPHPLYQLLESEDHWSCLGKVMQQQILQRGFENGHPVMKSYHLNVLLVSSLSPLRGFGSSSSVTSIYHSEPIHRSQVPVQNQKLTDLLAFMEFTKLHDHSSSTLSNTTDPATVPNASFVIARKELDRNEDLQLHLSTLGPLILPGPAVTGSVEGPQYDEFHHQYCYANGWPALNQSLLEQSGEGLHNRIHELQKIRRFTFEKVSCLKLCISLEYILFVCFVVYIR